jgi:hypothetical protein
MQNLEHRRQSDLLEACSSRLTVPPPLQQAHIVSPRRHNSNHRAFSILIRAQTTIAHFFRGYFTVRKLIVRSLRDELLQQDNLLAVSASPSLSIDAARCYGPQARPGHASRGGLTQSSGIGVRTRPSRHPRLVLRDSWSERMITWAVMYHPAVSPPPPKEQSKDRQNCSLRPSMFTGVSDCALRRAIFPSPTSRRSFVTAGKADCSLLPTRGLQGDVGIQVGFVGWKHQRVMRPSL